MNIINEAAATPSLSIAGSPATTASMRLAKPSITFVAKSSDQVLTVISGRIFAGLAANAAYPAPVPTLATLTTARNAFITAVNGNDRGKFAIAARDKARAQLESVLRDLSWYVAQQSQGDLVTLLSSGYPAQRQARSAVQIAPVTPGNVRASSGPASGQIIVRCKPAVDGVLYQWRYATAQAPTAYTATDPASKAKVTLANLVPGTQYQIQVRACGKRGSSDWSNAVAVYAV